MTAKRMRSKDKREIRKLKAAAVAGAIIAVAALPFAVFASGVFTQPDYSVFTAGPTATDDAITSSVPAITAANLQAAILVNSVYAEANGFGPGDQIANVVVRYSSGTPTCGSAESQVFNFYLPASSPTSADFLVGVPAITGNDIPANDNVIICGSLTDTLGNSAGKAYYQITYDGSSPVNPNPPNYTTRVISMVPTQGEATSTTPTLAFSAYVNLADLSPFETYRVIALLTDQNGLTNPVGTQYYNEVATTTGEIDFSTSSPSISGNFAWQVSIVPQFFSTITGYQTPITQVDQFVAGTSTFAGALAQQLTTDVNNQLVGNAPTSTQGALNSCNPFTGGNAITCVYALVVPDASSTQTFIADMQSVMNHAPIGYATLFVSDVNQGLSTTTVGLPSLVITLPNGFPGAGTSVDLTPWNDLLGPTSILATTTDPNSGKTLQQAVEPGWDDFIYFLFVIVLFGEISGVGGKWVSSGSL